MKSRLSRSAAVWSRSCLLGCGLVGAALAQGPGAAAPVVINEFRYDEVALDLQEYVELFNATGGPVDLSGWQLQASDQGGVYAAHAIPQGTILQPGGYYVMGSLLTPAVDQVIGVSNVFQDDNESLVLLDSGGLVVDAVAYEAHLGLWPGARFEGEPIFGEHKSEPFFPSSWARLRDGWDTGDNARDFRNVPSTPGASNDLPAIYPLTESYDGFPAGTVLQSWAGTRQAPHTLDPATLANVPPSPQGGNVAAFDVGPVATGGQSFALLGDVEGGIVFDAYVYLDAAPVQGGESFAWTIGVRGTTGSEFGAPDPARTGSVDQNGDTGVCWTYRVTASGAVLYLVDNRAGGRDQNVLARVPITQGLNDGWRRLRLSAAGTECFARLGGTVGGYDGTLFQARVLDGVGGVFVGLDDRVAGRAVQLLLDGVSVGTGEVMSINGGSGCQGNCPPKNSKTKNIATKRTVGDTALPSGDYAFYVDPGGPVQIDAICFRTALVGSGPSTTTTQLFTNAAGVPGSAMTAALPLVAPGGAGWGWWYATTALSTSSPFWIVLHADGSLFLPIAEDEPGTVLEPSQFRPNSITPWTATPTDERWVYQLVCRDKVGDSDSEIDGEAAPGTMFGFKMGGGAAGSFGFVVLGLGLQFPPLDLGPFGAPGCSVYPVNQATGLVFTDFLGSGTYLVAVPTTPVFSGVELYSQWLLPDSQVNPLGIASSRWTSATIR